MHSKNMIYINDLQITNDHVFGIFQNECHWLRHSVAMSILQSTGDVRKVSLWLGHADLKTTEMYLRASPVEKLQILQTNTPPSIQPGTFAGVEDQLVRLLSGK